LIVAPVGGGGLVSGTALAAHYFSPTTQVFGGEPSGADDAFRSLEKGEIVPSVHPKTIADGLLTSLGNLTFPIIREHVAEIIRVEEDEIIAAMRMVWERMKIIIEPSAAVAVAAVLRSAPRFSGRRVGIILSGGNVDLNRLPF
jgi:threonine dehydratase